MLKFIKSLFAKKEVVVVSISFKEFPQWFESKKTELVNSTNEKYKNILKDISYQKELIVENSKLLESATLRNSKIPERAKHFMEGNRSAYIKSAAIFMNKLILPNNINNLKSLHDFISQFNSDLDYFSKSTLKQYHILQEFFADESGKIAQNIRLINNKVNDIKSLIESNHLSLLDEIIHDQKRIDNSSKLKKELNHELKEKKKELLNFNQSLDENTKSKHALIISKEHKDFEHLKNEVSNLKSELKSLESSFIQYFGIIEKALKKYSKISLDYEKLGEDYLAHPLKAIISDSSLKILDLFEGVVRNLNSSGLGLDDKKKEKTLQTIKILDKVYLSNFLSKHIELSNQLNDVEDKVASSDLKKKIHDIESHVSILNVNIFNVNHRIVTLEKDLSDIDVDKQKNDIKEKIKILFDVDLTFN